MKGTTLSAATEVMNGGKSARFATRLMLLFSAVSLSLSCAIFAPRPRTAGESIVPEAYTMYSETRPAPDRWWVDFQSPELSQLIDRALEDGLTIEQAYARLNQARAVVVQTRAGLFPEVDATGAVTWSRRKIELDDSGGGSAPSGGTGTTGATGTPGGSGSTPSGGTTTGGTGTTAQTESEPRDTTIRTTQKNKQLGLISTYEVDLWGRIRSQYEAARLDREASREDLYTAALSLAAEVTVRWLDVLSHKQRLALVREQLKANETQLELMELRYLKSLATALDVFQQRQIVAETRSQIPPLEANLQTLENELAVLLGKPPMVDLSLDATTFPAVGVLPETGLPADLLADRPDVRASGLRLRSADWRVSAARADRLPALRLTASANINGENWSDIFDNWAANLAANVVAPVFDAGFRRAEVRRTRAVVDERLAVYRFTVLTAIREVQDALINEQKQVEFIAALEDRLEAARASYGQALERYLRGLNDYLPVLTSLTAVQVLERGLIVARFQRLAFRVQLHRALGGAWMHEELQNSRDVEL